MRPRGSRDPAKDPPPNARGGRARAVCWTRCRSRCRRGWAARPPSPSRRCSSSWSSCCRGGCGATERRSSSVRRSRELRVMETRPGRRPRGHGTLATLSGANKICEHGRHRSRCKECGGGSICPHGRQRMISLPVWSGGRSFNHATRRRRRVAASLVTTRPRRGFARAAPCDGNAANTSRPVRPDHPQASRCALALVRHPAGASHPAAHRASFLPRTLEGTRRRRCRATALPEALAARRPAGRRGVGVGRGRRGRRCETDACRRRTPRVQGDERGGGVVGEIGKEIIRRRPEIIRRPAAAFHPSASSRSSRSRASASARDVDPATAIVRVHRLRAPPLKLRHGRVPGSTTAPRPRRRRRPPPASSPNERSIARPAARRCARPSRPPFHGPRRPR